MILFTYFEKSITAHRAPFVLCCSRLPNSAKTISSSRGSVWGDISFFEVQVRRARVSLYKRANYLKWASAKISKPRT
jgi:hypothetical protein